MPMVRDLVWWNQLNDDDGMEVVELVIEEDIEEHHMVETKRRKK